MQMYERSAGVRYFGNNLPCNGLYSSSWSNHSSILGQTLVALNRGHHGILLLSQYLGFLLISDRWESTQPLTIYQITERIKVFRVCTCISHSTLNCGSWHSKPSCGGLTWSLMEFTLSVNWCLFVCTSTPNFGATYVRSRSARLLLILIKREL